MVFLNEFNIEGRGKVVSLNLTENGFNFTTNEEVNNHFLHKEITYKDEQYIVIGIERKAVNSYQDLVGFLIKLKQE